jgi:hypothetical protein
MILAIQGSKSFNDYPVLRTAMGRAMFKMSVDESDKELFVYSAGAAKTNKLIEEFVGVSEAGFRARKMKIQLRKVPPSWIKENMEYIDYLAYFCVRGEVVDPIVNFARSKGVTAEPYRY